MARAEPVRKTLQGSSIPIEADRKVALQGWSGNMILGAASECADRSRTTEERARVCAGGNPNSDFGRSKEERSRQSFNQEDQVSVIACKA